MAITKKQRANISGGTCPLPLRKYPTIVLGHGSGGQMTHELIQSLFIPAFGAKDHAPQLTDAAICKFSSEQLAFTTDSFVVQPLIFPGGDIGSLSVNGTVNDLAMMGARPLYLSVGFILEEGLPMEVLVTIVQSMSEAAKEAGVSIVTGDTKVVQKNHGDGLYINTSGVGIVQSINYPQPKLIKPGDVLIVNGTLGDHGMAIMSVREHLSFETEVVSDSAALNKVVLKLLAACPTIHAMRDLTRGGLAAGLNELSQTAQVGMIIEESQLPVNPQVKSSCEIMGFDPINIANEGKFLIAVPQSQAQNVIKILKDDPLGKKAAVIGQVVEDYPGIVIARTSIGGERVIDMPPGELLPRIC